ncbi:MAG: hypothetical protein RQ899_07520 [Pseudomonadales bacterium]|nr:hypothetical protein [Pseudomonadales bacterium]
MRNMHKQFFLILLLTLTVSGMQLIKDSPLHDHTHHVVDCAICHLSANDDATVSNDALLPQSNLVAVFHAYSGLTARSIHTAVYQSRAPPLSF